MLKLQRQLGNRAVQQLLLAPATHVSRPWQQSGSRRAGGEPERNTPAHRTSFSRATEGLQRWGELEHKVVGNRAQNAYPYRGTIRTDLTALRHTPRKDPSNPHVNTTADLLSGATVLVVGHERAWLKVVVESGSARDKKGATVAAQTLTGYISQELVTKSAGVFDSELPIAPGLNLSYGDLVAFGGDHFKDFAQLTSEASTAAGRARLEKLRDVIDNLPTKSASFEDEKTISKAYAERFRDLALVNIPHFSHGGTAGPTWQRIHTEAVLAALEAGKKGEGTGLAKAYAFNAFGDHFLTDMFSSGHVRVPREQIIVYYKQLMRDVFWHIVNHVSARLGNRIFRLLERDYRRVRWFGDAGDRQRVIDGVRNEFRARITAAGGAAKLQELLGLYVAGAFSKILHDEDNDNGLNVVSKKHPEGWTALGDGNLNVPANAKNLAYMTESVQASKRDLLDAFNIGADVLRVHGKMPPQGAIDKAMADLAKKIGPPYAALDFVPAPAPGVTPLAAWEWGKLDTAMKTKLVGIISRYLTADFQKEFLGQFDVVKTVDGFDTRPREAATDVFQDVLADPMAFLESAIGRAAGP